MIPTTLYVLYLKNAGEPVMPGDWKKKTLYLYLQKGGGKENLEKNNTLHRISIPEKSVKLDHKNIAV